MTRETTTALAPQEVLRRAREFFATRVPATGAFVERESDRHLVLRGQGGEEIVIAAVAEAGGGATRVRGSTLLFEQQLGRFFSTLPPVVPSGVDAAGVEAGAGAARSGPATAPGAAGAAAGGPGR